MVNELATVAAEPGIDEEKVAEMIMEKVKTEKDRKRFEEGIKGQAVVAKQEMKERDAEKKLAAAQAGVNKEKERQTRAAATTGAPSSRPPPPWPRRRRPL